MGIEGTEQAIDAVVSSTNFELVVPPGMATGLSDIVAGEHLETVLAWGQELRAAGIEIITEATWPQYRDAGFLPDGLTEHAFMPLEDSRVWYLVERLGEGRVALGPRFDHGTGEPREESGARQVYTFRTVEDFEGLEEVA